MCLWAQVAFDYPPPIGPPKVMDGKISKAKNMRTKYDAAVASYHALQYNLKNDPEWFWATSLNEPIEKAFHRRQKTVLVNELWSTWAISPSWVADIRKRWKMEEIDDLLSATTTVDQTILDLQSGLGKLFKMQAARTS